jgi:hypothetical protein
MRKNVRFRAQSSSPNSTPLPCCIRHLRQFSHTIVLRIFNSGDTLRSSAPAIFLAAAVFASSDRGADGLSGHQNWRK